MRGTVLAATFGLFAIWAASFIAIEALLTGQGGPARMTPLSLTTARFAPVAVFCGAFCLLRHRGECIRIVTLYWHRLLVSGVLSVWGYNLALYYGQQQSVPAPIASLLTCLAPLYLLLLSAAFLDERITRRKVFAFFIALSGLTVIALAKDSGGAVAYPLLILITALAPLSWSVHSVVSKPPLEKVSPLLWTYLSLTVGGAPLLAILPFSGGPEMLRLDLEGWAMLGYLSIFCTILGFTLWIWLLRRLPASTAGFTIFLNPPLTTGYKLLLAALFPTSFAFSVVPAELVGAVLLLTGVAVALSVPGTNPPTRWPCRG